jgi:putative isomerase
MKITPLLSNAIALLRSKIPADALGLLREPGGALQHPFIVPGSAQYHDQLWDWDCWLTNVALRQIALESGDNTSTDKLRPYERGCILNFLAGTSWHGWMPIMLPRKGAPLPADPYASNMHKPVIAQHAAFLIQEDGGNAEWLRESFFGIQAFLNNYRSHHRHSGTGLYFWQDDACIGGDNDPCTYGRPPRSSGSIYLNCLMVKELEAASYLARQLGQVEVSAALNGDAESLIQSIRTHCWDEWTGSYYSVDLNIGRFHSTVPRDDGLPLHAGLPMDWTCLIQRFGVWSNFLALWSGVATAEQAKRMATEHYRDVRTFGCPSGIRTLSKMEKMYSIRASGNPSSWLGPVWGVSNYLTFRGFVRYGLDDEAIDLCDKTILLFARDLERFASLHEYYEPETGEPLLNRGFQNWNLLVLNMAAWREGRSHVAEF